MAPASSRPPARQARGKDVGGGGDGEAREARQDPGGPCERPAREVHEADAVPERVDLGPRDAVAQSVRAPGQGEGALGLHPVELGLGGGTERLGRIGRAGDDAPNPAHRLVGRNERPYHAVLAHPRGADHGNGARARHGAKAETSTSRSATASRAGASWKMPTTAAPRALASRMRSNTTARFTGSSEAVGSSSSSTE